MVSHHDRFFEDGLGYKRLKNKHTLRIGRKAALQVLVEIRQRLGEDAKLRFNLFKVKNLYPWRQPRACP